MSTATNLHEFPAIEPVAVAERSRRPIRMILLVVVPAFVFAWEESWVITPALGIVNTWRTGGMREGLKKVCPNIPEDKYVSFESNGETSQALAPARDLLAAHPDAKKMLVVGINDGGVLGAIQAAEQLGRADEVIGWGQAGALITGPNVNPHLLGSVFYFLEGYAVYSFGILDKIAAGSPPPMKDTAEDPAARVPPCPVTAAQAQKVPDMPERVKTLLAAAKGTTEYDLFCPSK